GLPQVTMNFPEYRKINDRYRVAVLLDDLSVDGVSACINETMKNRDFLQQMNKAAMVAREVYNWQAEEKGLLQFYQKLFS
ncbi:MAG TPA: group 1 glycosyl transferase, partial [Flavisolibacter sp.]|nr:group 1 glycosyl transferase [Flavisolibacter sp.]